MDLGIAVIGAVASLPTSYLVAAVMITITLYLWPIWRASQYPPGPTPLPVIGNMHFFLMNKNPHKIILEGYGKKYKDLITLWKGTSPSIYLLSDKAIHEAFREKADVLSQRRQNTIFTFYGAEGLFGCKDGDWQLHRRLVLNVFKEKGVGHVTMEEQIRDECEYLMEELDKKVGVPFDPRNQLLQTVSNVITRIIFGNRFEYSSEQLDNIQFDEYLVAKYITEAMPFLRPILVVCGLNHAFYNHASFIIIESTLLTETNKGDPLKFDYEAKRKRFVAGEAFVREQIKTHREALDMENPRDFIDAFLIEIEHHKEDKNTTYTVPELFATVMDLYIAGSDTTATSMDWAFLAMVENPNAQRKVQDEIDTVIGSRTPECADIKSMPYTQALITDVLRKPISETLAHIASEDVTICGEKIPKGTEVYAMLYGVHHCEENYQQPGILNLERFINSEGAYNRPEKGFIPFSTGPRACPGEALTRAELFLFLTSTLQKFDICQVPGEKYGYEGKYQLTYTPISYKVLLKRRS